MSLIRDIFSAIAIATTVSFAVAAIVLLLAYTYIAISSPDSCEADEESC